MKKDAVIKHFGSRVKTALAVGVTKQAVSGWGQVIPEGMAYKIQVLTGGKLRVNPALYDKSSRPPAA